jgi:hypothetical protein
MGGVDLQTTQEMEIEASQDIQAMETWVKNNTKSLQIHPTGPSKTP